MAHNHNHFNIEQGAERKTFIVIILTLITMFAEIIVGYLSNSMALLADGWHMGTHAFALSITFVAYIFIRKFKNSNLFAMGTGKISSLAAYTSSIFLGFTAFWIIFESVQRLLNPLKIAFSEAILVAIIGLIVNGLCLIIMEYKTSKVHKDYNFKSAYIHILTDAFTSVLAIAALLCGKFFNFYYLDSIVGLAGGFVILKWAYGLIKNTSAILLDMNDLDMQKHICEHLSENGIEIVKLNVWRASENSYCISCTIKQCDKNIEGILSKIDDDHHFERIDIKQEN